MPEKPRLLVVDDDYHVRRLLDVYLRSSSYETEFASSSEEALALAARYRFDVVLLDLIIPHGGGLHVCRNLKGASNPPYVIIVSGEESGEMREASVECGADEYIVKPFVPADLLARLENLAPTLSGRGAAS